MSKFHPKIVVKVDEFRMAIPVGKLLFKTKIECIKCVTENFMHLDKTVDNIFSYNAPNSIFKGLFLNITS